MPQPPRPARKRLALSEPEPPRRPPDHAPVRSAVGWLGSVDRARSGRVRHPQSAPHQGRDDLQAHGQPAGLSAPAGAHETGEHGPIPRPHHVPYRRAAIWGTTMKRSQTATQANLRVCLLISGWMKQVGIFRNGRFNPTPSARYMAKDCARHSGGHPSLWVVIWWCRSLPIA